MAETYRERLVREHPTWRDEAISTLLVTDCPCDYGYCEEPELNWCMEHKCEECWNREISEEGEKNMGLLETNLDYAKMYDEEHAALEQLEQLHKKDQIQIATLKDQLEKQGMHIATLERRLERYRLVVRCIEAFTGEKLDIE